MEISIFHSKPIIILVVDMENIYIYIPALHYRDVYKSVRFIEKYTSLGVMQSVKGIILQLYRKNTGPLTFRFLC